MDAFLFAKAIINIVPVIFNICHFKSCDLLIKFNLKQLHETKKEWKGVYNKIALKCNNVITNRERERK